MSMLSMYRRIYWPGWAELYRRKLPAQLEVLNLIDYRDRELYLWYGLFVMPTIYGVGGSVRWAGEWEESLLGERQGEALLVIRYPSHRRFLLMVTNPYYALINRLREKGDAWFEASFTLPEGDPQVLRRQRQLLVLHCQDEAQAARVEPLLTAAGAERVYALHEVASLDFFSEQTPSDPHPLRMKRVLFFKPGALGAGLPDPLRAQLLAESPDVSLQLYRGRSRKAMLPGAVAKLIS